FVEFFFFQAEDGIRDRNVTGVQTCALPIYYALLIIYCTFLSNRLCTLLEYHLYRFRLLEILVRYNRPIQCIIRLFHSILSRILRSEERRVGKEGRGVWCTDGDLGEIEHRGT